ncbi:MAG: hypothetical protein CDV28_10266 [Candidatus Electronema aureum]|uniref:Predicted pPIWI-associating nuclease domain-containing protein n=1 Tax=Candidatus Electronema aureum TaxID=2005002 RepID=A0A521G4J1_9BACT|nr:MAG: hypothetical protein CDV28_10266 [Candidatus Electronema aureum]
MEDLYKKHFGIEKFKEFDITETAASISHRLLAEIETTKHLGSAIDTEKLTGRSASLAEIEAASIDRSWLADAKAVKHLCSGSAMDIDKLTGRSASLAEIEAASIDRSWLADAKAAKCISLKIDAVNSALYSHVDSISKISLFAQERIDSAQFFLRENSIYNTNEMMKAVKSLGVLTENYNSFVRSFDSNEIRITNFPPFVSRLPSIELLTSSRLLETISRDGNEDADDQTEPIESEITEDIECSLEELLDWFHPQIRQLLHGAKKALTSGNPDKNRHVVVSLREMITHILHGIAPDDKVHEWTKEPSHYDKGRPTRKARMLYVCRNINHGKFAEFLNEDVNSHVKFIGFFQSGTHSIDIKITNSQLKALIVRTEALARFLLVTARNTR